MRIGVPKEIAQGERRVALVPEVVRRLQGTGHEVFVETNAGFAAKFDDDAFHSAGATVVQDKGEVWGCDLVVKVAPPSDKEVANLNPSSVLVGFLSPLSNPELVRAIEGTGATAFAMEAVPRISRAQSMDALSSQATVAGYKSVLLAANISELFCPLLMTAAGTIPPAKILVLGAGVAGLQAIATARRLGALVTAFDVRSSVKEQIESLGAKFLELGESREAEAAGGYARAMTEEEQAQQQQKLTEKITKIDIVISTALVPGKPAPRLITAAAVEGMAPGSVIVDLAGEAGGNCELSVPGETITTSNQVTIAAPLNLPSEMAGQASQLFARNIESLLQLMTGEEKQLALDFNDEVIAGACVVRGKAAQSAQPSDQQPVSVN